MSSLSPFGLGGNPGHQRFSFLGVGGLGLYCVRVFMAFRTSFVVPLCSFSLFCFFLLVKWGRGGLPFHPRKVEFFPGDLRTAQLSWLLWRRRVPTFLGSVV